MNSTNCERCGRFYFVRDPAECICKQWQCHVFDGRVPTKDSEEWTPYYALDVEDAAVKAAEAYSEDDPPEDGQEIVVFTLNDDVVTKHTISVNYSIDYCVAESEVAE